MTGDAPTLCAWDHERRAAPGADAEPLYRPAPGAEASPPGCDCGDGVVCTGCRIDHEIEKTFATPPLTWGVGEEPELPPAEPGPHAPAYLDDLAEGRVQTAAPQQLQMF